MELDMDESYFRPARPTQPLDRQAPNSHPKGLQISHTSVPPHRHHRPPIHHINLTGFTCQPGDPEYAEAARATGTKGNKPVYWFKEYRYNNGSYDDLASLLKIQELMQADRDALLYPNTSEKRLETPTKERSRETPTVSSLCKGERTEKDKKVQFMEQVIEFGYDQHLNKSPKGGRKKVQFVDQVIEFGYNQHPDKLPEGRDECNETQAQADEKPDWI